MKILTLIFLLFVASSFVRGQTSTRGEGDTHTPTFYLDHVEYDFGNITEGVKVKHIFSLTNKGYDEIYIMDIETGCNCTASDYSLEPIAKGEKTNIVVEFDSDGKVGAQLKEIVIKTDKGDLVCKMFGTVFPKNKDY